MVVGMRMRLKCRLYMLRSRNRRVILICRYWLVLCAEVAL